MKKLLSGLISVILCLAICGCAQEEPAKEASKAPDIPVKNGVFDMNADQCRMLLNEDFQKAGLPEIPEKYSKETLDVVINEQEEKTCTTYKWQLSDEVCLELVSFPELEDGIPVIKIVGAYSSHEQVEGAKQAKQYYEIICQNTAAGFDAENFNPKFYKNEHYEMDGLYFWCGFVNSGDEKDKAQKEWQYLVTTNQELLSYY